MKNPAVAGLFCAFSLLTCAAAAQETTPAMSAVETAPAAAVNSELEAALGTVSAAEAAEAAQQQTQPAATAPAASSVDALSSNAVPTSSSEESGQTSETPLAVNSAASEELSGEPQEYSMRMAFLLPAADSPLEGPSQTALLGLLAANYASEHPAEVLLVRPGSNGSAVDQLKAAARAGAQVAVGPLDRAAISEIAKLNYLPLPLVTLNEIELNELTPMTQDEIFAERRLREAQKNAAALEAAEERPLEAAMAEKEAADNQPTGGRISNKTKVPGLVLAEEIELPFYNRTPLKFPRNMLMLGMSMEHDAEYVARLGVAALPETTEAGEKPKVLLIDHDTPLEKRVSQAFEQELIRMGFTPDRLTVDLNEFTRLRKFFELVVEKLNTDEFDEVLIDQEADPVGWRQQQIRIRRLQAAKRARVALSEPPYYAAFLAMDAKNASLVRSRLPIRTRVWATSLTNPGETATDSAARAMTYDLLQVGLVDAPLILNFNPEEFEQTYQVPVPETTFDKRLFALGADAYALSQSVAHGISSAQIKGLLGTLTYNLNFTPVVDRRAQTAMIQGGVVKPVSEEDLVDFEVLRQSKRLRAQSRSLERLTREAERAAQEAGTLAPNDPELESELLQQMQNTPAKSSAETPEELDDALEATTTETATTPAP